MSISSIPKSLRRRILERDGGQCQYCHLKQYGQGAVFHINHIVPRSGGGLTQESNLALQCPYCSLRKSDRVDANDPATGRKARLLHPIEQVWAEHVSLQPDGVCRGLTDTGRATVEALRMNDSLPLMARAMQIQMGILTALSS